MKRVSSLLLGLCVAACTQTPEPPIIMPAPPEPVVVDHWTDLTPRDAGTATVGPVAVGRVSRRLSTSQLDRSLRSLLGQGWDITGTLPSKVEVPGLPPVDVGVPFQFDALNFLGPGLGRADYLSSFKDNVDITPSFAKLMDNWASYQCIVAALHDMTTDFTAADAGTPLFLHQVPDPTLLPDGGSSPARRATMLETVRLARLHFQSVYTTPANAEAELGHLVDTAEAVSRRRRAETRVENDGGIVPRFSPAQADLAGLAAACTLLLTDPEFVTY